MNLTELGLRALQPPETGQKDHFDDSLPGFGIRISQGGARSFFVFSGSKHQRERTTIGRYPLVSLAQAREIAKALLAERTLNQHRPPSIKFEEAYQQFKKMHCARKRPRTSKASRRNARSSPITGLRLLTGNWCRIRIRNLRNRW